MENSIEEDIKILEELRIANENCIKNAKIKDNPFVAIWEKQNRAIEHILSDYKRVLKENEELKQERELVGVPVRNKRDGKIGIILHQWKSGSIAVLENIKPRVINTHDDWNTLEIINDNVEQKRTKNDCIPIEKVKDKIEEILNNKEYRIVFEGNAEFPDDATIINAQKYIKLEKMQELIEESEEK